MEVATASDLSAIMDDLRYELSDERGWYHNRTHIFDAFKDSALYVVVETVPESARTQVLTMDKQSSYPCEPATDTYDCHVPAFVVHYPDPCRYVNTIIWVRRDFRRKGYGTFMVEARRITSVDPTPKSSVPFWMHRGFRPVGVVGAGIKLSRMDLPGATTAVDIAGLDKRMLLEALVSGKASAARDSLGHAAPFDVDYFKGCAVKSNLSFDLADPDRYNKPHYHGAGAFEEVVQALRARASSCG